MKNEFEGKWWKIEEAIYVEITNGQMIQLKKGTEIFCVLSGKTCYPPKGFGVIEDGRAYTKLPYEQLVQLKKSFVCYGTYRPGRQPTRSKTPYKIRKHPFDTLYGSLVDEPFLLQYATPGYLSWERNRYTRQEILDEVEGLAIAKTTPKEVKRALSQLIPLLKDALQRYKGHNVIPKKTYGEGT